MARSARSDGAVLSLHEAARELGLTEDDLVALVLEAGVALPGPREGWLLDAADVEAVKAEREKQRAKNLAELAKLAAFFDEG